MVAQNIRKSLGTRKKWTKYVNKDTEAIAGIKYLYWVLGARHYIYHYARGGEGRK